VITNHRLPPLYDCKRIERRAGARGSSKTEEFRVTSEALTKGSVYGSFILIRFVDPGNRTRCDLFHLRGVVSVAGHFVDAAGGYSDVDPCCNIHFVARTGTCDLKCVIPDEAAYESWEDLREGLARFRELHGSVKIYVCDADRWKIPPGIRQFIGRTSIHSSRREC